MSTARPTSLQLPEGRSIDVFESGPADGPVLLFHHGTPGSGFPIRRVVDVAHRLGLRYVSTSRPGYGESTRQPGRTVVDVVTDTAAVLDALGVDRCVTAGWSGGGPHALACAARLSERVEAVLVIAGVAPYSADGLDFLAGMGQENLVEFGKTLEGEDVLRPYLEEVAVQMRRATPEHIVAALGSLLSPVDHAALTGDVGEDFASNFHEALRVGIEGWLDDDLAFVKPWGFELGEVAVPTALWQGDQDRMVPIAHGRWLAEHIPGVVAHMEDGEGHLSIGIGAIDRMLGELLAASGHSQG